MTTKWATLLTKILDKKKTITIKTDLLITLQVNVPKSVFNEVVKFNADDKAINNANDRIERNNNKTFIMCIPKDNSDAVKGDNVLPEAFLIKVPQSTLQIPNQRRLSGKFSLPINIHKSLGKWG